MGNHEQHPGAKEAPRVIFPIGDKQINILEALDNHETRLSTSNRRPGDVEAQVLLRMLGNSLVTSEEYLRTMPKLFEYAAKPEGGFDRDFLQVAFIEFDNTAKRMDTRSLTMLLVGRQEDNETRHAYLGRAYGRVETIKELIWDDPLMEDKKRQLVQSARQEIRDRYDRILPDLDEPI